MNKMKFQTTPVESSDKNNNSKEKETMRRLIETGNIKDGGILCYCLALLFSALSLLALTSFSPVYASGPDTNPITHWDTRYNYFLRFPAARQHGVYDAKYNPDGHDVVEDQKSKGPGTVVHSKSGPVFKWPVTVETATSEVPTLRDEAIQENLFQTFGYPVSDTQLQIIERYNHNRFLEQLYDPEKVMWMATSVAGVMANSAGNSTADMGTNQCINAIDYTRQPIANFTVEPNNVWQQIRYELFIPMAVLLLLPGAVLAQVRAIVAQGSPVIGDVNPFEGILRSIIAIFLIPGSYLVINYGIDVANSLTYTIADEYHRIFGSDMYEDAKCAIKRALPINDPNSNRNAIEPPIKPPKIEHDVWSPYESLSLTTRLYDPCVGVDQSRLPDEDVPANMMINRLLFNGTIMSLGLTWNIYCAFQLAFLYYLWCMGPIAAAMWVWPIPRLRQAFGSWVEGVIVLCFWALFWNTSILLLAAFKGTGDSGTVYTGAVVFLCVQSVKSAFDFVSLVSSAASGAESMAKEALGQLGSAMSQAKGSGGGNTRAALATAKGRPSRPSTGGGGTTGGSVGSSAGGHTAALSSHSPVGKEGLGSQALSLGAGAAAGALAAHGGLGSGGAGGGHGPSGGHGAGAKDAGLPGGGGSDLSAQGHGAKGVGLPPGEGGKEGGKEDGAGGAAAAALGAIGGALGAAGALGGHGAPPLSMAHAAFNLSSHKTMGDHIVPMSQQDLAHRQEFLHQAAIDNNPDAARQILAQNEQHTVAAMASAQETRQELSRAGITAEQFRQAQNGDVNMKHAISKKMGGVGFDKIESAYNGNVGDAATVLASHGSAEIKDMQAHGMTAEQIHNQAVQSNNVAVLAAEAVQHHGGNTMERAMGGDTAAQRELQSTIAQSPAVMEAAYRGSQAVANFEGATHSPQSAVAPATEGQREIQDMKSHSMSAEQINNQAVQSGNVAVLAAEAAQGHGNVLERAAHGDRGAAKEMSRAVPPQSPVEPLSRPAPAPDPSARQPDKLSYTEPNVYASGDPNAVQPSGHDHSSGTPSHAPKTEPPQVDPRVVGGLAAGAAGAGLLGGAIKGRSSTPASIPTHQKSATPSTPAPAEGGYQNRDLSPQQRAANQRSEEERRRAKQKHDEEVRRRIAELEDKGRYEEAQEIARQEKERHRRESE